MVQLVVHDVAPQDHAVMVSPGTAVEPSNTIANAGVLPLLPVGNCAPHDAPPQVKTSPVAGNAALTACPWMACTVAAAVVPERSPPSALEAVCGIQLEPFHVKTCPPAGAAADTALP